MSSQFLDVVVGLLAALAGRRGWLNEWLNGFLIGMLVKAGRNRPHPWATRSDYISWSSLTDRTFSARLLPAAEPTALLPSVNDVQALFAASPEGQRPCPKSTCLFPAFAQYLTDGFIRTKLSNVDAEEDRARTTSNHEIDQSPLYGRTPTQTNVLRLRSNEAGQKGRLKSQMIGGEEYPLFLYLSDGQTIDPQFCDASGVPLLDMPLGVTKPWAKKGTLFAVGGDRANASPQVSMMNTLFLREHNRLAQVIEGAHGDWDDDRVFETARNISIVMFIKLVVEDYINHINTAPFHLRALPNAAWSAKWNRPNWITAEFSLLYRWHSLIPESMRWGDDVLMGTQLTLDNGVLLARGLTNAFVDVSANGATQLGLGNSASFLVPIEGKAIEQARHNLIAPFNAYRRAMHQSPATSFADVVGHSSDPKEQARRDALAGQLEALYGVVDNVEFYVGLFAEPNNRNGPLPPLLQAMVAMDAFSQALTNPLLSQHIWGNDTNRTAAFTREGLAAIDATESLRDVMARNGTGLGDRFVGMTKQGWKRS
jgi:prostaglandin-endoperoxide synthase 2